MIAELGNFETSRAQSQTKPILNCRRNSHVCIHSPNISLSKVDIALQKSYSKVALIMIKPFPYEQLHEQGGWGLDEAVVLHRAAPAVRRDHTHIRIHTAVTTTTTTAAAATTTANNTNNK